MRRFVMCIASFTLVAAAPAPAAQSQSSSAASRSTCDAKYYDYLVGKNLDSARDISGTNYRVLAQGAAAGAAQPKRMTVTVDKGNQIVDVSCN
ncbi:hypothetical protein [Sphingomonas sp. URHD0057]|uniref:hypothetical protein n=1 Tax=Sphingomonas sp. URHD0057 TaxID=1380389 RepID=UPI0012DE092F|nr:hypothetical protein [Sphingomonas sp. URHD0057]